MVVQKPQRKGLSKAIEENRELLGKISEKIDGMIKMQRTMLQQLSTEAKVTHGRVNEGALKALDVMTLLSLPDHLRKTAMVTCELGKATAGDVAKVTKRARAVESGYLNQLVVMGYLKKNRKGRKAYFYV